MNNLEALSRNDARELYQDVLDAIRRLGEISNKRNKKKTTMIFLTLIDCADLLKIHMTSMDNPIEHS